MKRKFEFQISERFHKKRLDEFLFNEFRGLSKAYLRRVVKEEGCQWNGYPANSGLRLKTGDFIEIEVDIRQEKGMKAEKMPLDIIFEDSQILIINKPFGMLVHPTNYERNGTLLNGLTYYLNKNKTPEDFFIRPHLIHRLDRETSGLMVIAKDPQSSRILSRHFKKKLFEKKYLALVQGILKPDSGNIETDIGRDETEKRWKVMENSKPSQTLFRVLERLEDRTLVELEPVTGRTNQLRIHCAHIGHPIIGDQLHRAPEFKRLCLHASKLSFYHPEGGKRKMEFSSPIIFE